MTEITPEKIVSQRLERGVKIPGLSDFPGEHTIRANLLESQTLLVNMRRGF